MLTGNDCNHKSGRLLDPGIAVNASALVDQAENSATKGDLYQIHERMTSRQTSCKGRCYLVPSTRSVRGRQRKNMMEHVVHSSMESMTMNCWLMLFPRLAWAWLSSLMANSLRHTKFWGPVLPRLLVVVLILACHTCCSGRCVGESVLHCYFCLTCHMQAMWNLHTSSWYISQAASIYQ